MRLAAKLVLLFLVGLLLIVSLFSYLTIQQDERLAMADHQRYAAALAATMQPKFQEAVRSGDGQELQRFFTQSTREQVSVRLVEWSSAGNDERRPSVPLSMIISTREITTISMPGPSGQNVLYTYVPVEVDETANVDPTGSIEISAPDVLSEARFRRSLHSSLLAIVGVTVLSGIVILVGGVAMVGRPLNELIAKVQRVGKGDFSAPVQLKSTDELGRLGIALNEMCDQLAEQRTRLNKEAAARMAALEQLRHADRLNTVGRMAAGIAHEIGTPLNVVIGRAELIADGQLAQQAACNSALTIQTEAKRIAKIIRELLDFARQTTPNRDRHAVNDIIISTANLMRPLANKCGAEIKIDMPQPPLEADFDSGQIQQVLTNLIVNAAQSVGDHGLITITLTRVNAQRPENPSHDGLAGSESPYCKISIQDTGAGMPDTVREHIFEPFFTTKDVGDGTGLGLSISHGIIHEHDGWIEVESEVGRGSCFSIYLPAPAQSEDASNE